MSRKRSSQPQRRPAQDSQAPAHFSAQDSSEQPPTPAAAGQTPPTGTPNNTAGGAHTPPEGTGGASRNAGPTPHPAQSYDPGHEAAHFSAQDSSEQPPTPAAAGQTPPTDTPNNPAGGAHTPPIEPEEHQEGQPQRHGPIWSASEAARRCGIGRATMTRRLQAGAIPGATRDEDGHWQVPLSGLLAAGFHPDRPAPPEAAPPEDEHAREEIAAAVELAELRGQLAVERARREAAEQLAAERAARIDDLRHALRAIEPPTPAQEEKPQPTTPDQPAQEPTTTPPQPQDEGVAGRLRRWWRGGA